MKLFKIIPITAVILLVAACDKNNSDIKFRATGNEPGWSMLIENNNAIVNLNYGADKAEFQLGNNKSENNTDYVFSANDFETQIIKQECQDTMADMIFPYTVKITVSGEEFIGCGRMIE